LRLPFALAVAIVAAPALARELPQTGMPKDFLYLRDVAPSIAQDIRYATPNNFTAATLPGYGAAECVLKREAAQALARVQADLAKQNLGLKVYDCYRPERAVAAMWRWAHDGKRDGNNRFYPNVEKSQLFALGYIAARSKHSTGTAVDLTLIPLNAPAPSARDRSAPNNEPCTAPAAQRAPDTSLDMGSGFDCLDVKSHTRTAAITPAQAQPRESLRAAMTRHGFHNYFREWWHYEYGPAPPQTYDFPIAPR
jgi:D-alanyl-D-alanine dipeptidase